MYYSLNFGILALGKEELLKSLTNLLWTKSFLWIISHRKINTILLGAIEATWEKLQTLNANFQCKLNLLAVKSGDYVTLLRLFSELQNRDNNTSTSQQNCKN